MFARLKKRSDECSLRSGGARLSKDFGPEQVRAGQMQVWQELPPIRSSQRCSVLEIGGRKASECVM